MADYRPASTSDMSQGGILSHGDGKARQPSKWVKHTLHLILVLVVLALFLWFFYEVVSRPDNEFVIGQFLLNVSPLVWGSLGLAIAFTFSIVGAGWYYIVSIVTPSSPF